MRHLLAICLFLLGVTPALAEESKEDRLARSVEELRRVIGRWEVVTEFLNEDGSVARTASGAYEFDWLTPDRVASGRSSISEKTETAGILFYVNEKKETIEMVSVGPDGALWVMTGPLGGDTRYTQVFDAADGGKAQLRFTSFNVERDRFESRMEYTSDGGATWRPGNHQIFRRVEASP